MVIPLIKKDGQYIVLDLVSRVLQHREREELDDALVRDWAALVLTDPFKSYSPDDSDRWIKVLEEAWSSDDYALALVMLLTRFAGTRLENGGGTWVMVPVMREDNPLSFWTEESWKAYRRDVLMPISGRIKELLRKKG